MALVPFWVGSQSSLLRVHNLFVPSLSSVVLSSRCIDGVSVADDQEEEDEGLGVDLSFIGSHAFARMEGDIDKQRRLILQGQLSEAALQKQHQRK